MGKIRKGIEAVRSHKTETAYALMAGTALTGVVMIGVAEQVKDSTPSELSAEAQEDSKGTPLDNIGWGLGIAGVLGMGLARTVMAEQRSVMQSDERYAAISLDLHLSEKARLDDLVVGLEPKEDLPKLEIGPHISIFLQPNPAQGFRELAKQRKLQDEDTDVAELLNDAELYDRHAGFVTNARKRFGDSRQTEAPRTALYEAEFNNEEQFRLRMLITLKQLFNQHVKRGSSGELDASNLGKKVEAMVPQISDAFLAFRIQNRSDISEERLAELDPSDFRNYSPDFCRLLDEVLPLAATSESQTCSNEECNGCAHWFDYMMKRTGTVRMDELNRGAKDTETARLPV